MKGGLAPTRMQFQSYSVTTNNYDGAALHLTCIKSNIPSSLSEESTQKTKYRVA